MRRVRRLGENTRIAVLLMRVLIHDHVSQLILKILRSIVTALIHVRQVRERVMERSIDQEA